MPQKMLKTVKEIFDTTKNQKNIKTIKKSNLTKLISIKAGASTQTTYNYIKFFFIHKLISHKRNSNNEYNINWENINELLKEQ